MPEFVEHAKRLVGERYPDLNGPRLHVDHRPAFPPAPRRHAGRRARQGATVVNLAPGQQPDPAQRKFAPHLLLGRHGRHGGHAARDLRPAAAGGRLLQCRRVAAYVNDQGPPARDLPVHARQGAAGLLHQPIASGGVSVNEGILHRRPATCRSAASAPAAWATTTATKASSPSPSCGRCSTRRRSRRSRCCSSRPTASARAGS